MLEEFNLIERCIAQSPTLLWLNDPANTSTIVLVLLAELVLHVLVFMAITNKLFDLMTRGISWLFHRFWKPVPPARFRYECGCAGEIIDLTRPEFEVVCGQGPIRAGFLQARRMQTTDPCELHRTFTPLQVSPSEDA